MIDYLAAIEFYHDGMEVTMSDCCDYNTIDWNGNVPIDQSQLDDEWLNIYKTDKIIGMSQQAEADIVDGFESDALGTSHWYDSQAEDQLNLVGSAAAGDDSYFSCRDTQLGDKTYVLHTHAQLVQVIQDGRDVKLGVLQTFTTKKDEVLAAVTKTDVDAIVW